MNIIFKSFWDKMNQYKILDSYMANANVVINNVRLLPKTENHSSNILYIGYLNDYRKEPSMTESECYICISDKNSSSKNFFHETDNYILLSDDSITLPELFIEIQNIMQQYHSYHDNIVKLFDMVVSDKKFQDIIDISTDMLGNPIYFSDYSLNLIAYSKNFIVEDPYWVEGVNSGTSNKESYDSFFTREILDRFIDEDEPFIIELNQNEMVRRILAKVMVENKIVGLIAILEYKKSFDDIDFVLTKKICEALSIKMRGQQSHSDFVTENTIITLLQGKNDCAEFAISRLKYNKWKFYDKYYVLVVRSNNPNQIKSWSFPLTEEMKRLLNVNDVYIMDENLIVVIGAKINEYKQENIFNKLSKFIINNGFYAGLSYSFTNITDIATYYRQALISIRIGQSEMRLEQSHFYDYADYAIKHMIEICSMQENVVDFCHPLLIQLLQIDKENKTDYLKSLHAFIMNKQNVSKAADALFIHRNTMYYRVMKIKEMLNLDFDDNDLIMKLFVSLKLFEFLNLIA